uniref:DDA1 domain-containing protein n=1 Tax=Steinernema glaseri TaxID=37863 RepID=A0A1I7ZJ10_9BILA
MEKPTEPSGHSDASPSGGAWFLQNLPSHNADNFKNFGLAPQTVRVAPTVIRSSPISPEERRIVCEHTPLLLSKLRKDTQERKSVQMKKKITKMYEKFMAGQRFGEHRANQYDFDEEDCGEDFLSEEDSDEEESDSSKEDVDLEVGAVIGQHESSPESTDTSSGEADDGPGGSVNPSTPTPPPSKRIRRS